MLHEEPREGDQLKSLVPDITARIAGVFKGPVLTAGIFGSQEEDVDILAVMEEMSWAFFHCVCTRLREAFPRSAIYPTHRLEEFVSCGKPQTDRQKVHFLCYPSLETFNRVERPFIRYSIAHTLQPVVGSSEVLLRDNSTRPAPDMAFYRNLLWETAQLYAAQSAPPDVLQNEVRRKLMYIVKFSLAETFYKESGRIDLTRLAVTLFEEPANPHCEIGGSLYREIRGWDNPGAEVVGNMFDQVHSLLKELERHGG